jgi:hypothetical protein
MQISVCNVRHESAPAMGLTSSDQRRPGHDLPVPPI